MMASSPFNLFCEIQAKDDPLAGLSVLLLSAKRLAETGAALELLNICNHIPTAIKRIIDNDHDADWKTEMKENEEGFYFYFYELLCELVKLAVTTFSTQVVGDPSTQAINLASVRKLVQALSIALDSGRKFYEFRRKEDWGKIVVCPWRLECALQVPGFFVRVRGAVDNQVHYLCSREGINHIGKACECCKPPSEADPILANLGWLLAKTASGSVYEYVVILKMLKSPRHLSFPTLGLLLQSFVQFLDYDNISDPSSSYLGQHVAKKSNVEFKDLCRIACSTVLEHLKKMVPANYVKGSEFEYYQISLLLNSLFKITCWEVSFYGDGSELDGVRDSVCELQQTMWQQLLTKGHCATMCMCIVAVLEATVPQASRKEYIPTLKWLQEKKVMAKLLVYHGYTMDEVPRVIEFVMILAKAEVVLTENDFLTPIKYFRETKCLTTNKDWIAHDRIVAAMLDILDVSAYSVEFLGSVLKWLEDRQAESVINGSRIFFILKKLVAHDKNETFEKRFLDLFSKHGASVSDSDLIDCLNRVADRYTFCHEIGTQKNILHTGDEQAKLLEACSSADIASSSSTDIDDALNHTHLYGQRAKNWEEKEINLYTTTSSKLANFLPNDAPFTRYETAKECFDRLGLAQHCCVRLTPDKSSTLAAVMTTAMSPELHTLEVLKKEIFLESQLVQRFEKLSEKHLQAYEALKQEQYERLMKFLEVCCREKKDVVCDYLCQKLKLSACVKKAMITREVKLSSDDILSRMLQKAGDAFKEMEVKLDTLEKTANNKCAVCYMDFSLKRKRACFDPCGHASTCIDCATREWKRTTKCPLCKTAIEKPIPVPCKLFI